MDSPRASSGSFIEMSTHGSRNEHGDHLVLIHRLQTPPPQQTVSAQPPVPCSLRGSTKPRGPSFELRGVEMEGACDKVVTRDSARSAEQNMGAVPNRIPRGLCLTQMRSFRDSRGV